jgi:transposase-like protein
MSTRRKYTREFKIEAAKLSYNSDKPVEAMAEKLGVSQSSLNRWRREFGTGL